ncbi:ABC transporter ATP-binding protein [Niallia circulans]|uniref:ABC transporter ATP-binding protein n=1 Tax=Niallia circulans TaxID=1397 RepID=A0A941GDD2_NIACI|nr:ABC transporter ATP-binding protein [Niallia circulans]MCB5236900.1 ABC transporter ATP-binding protein [Niallia circulans]
MTNEIMRLENITKSFGDGGTTVTILKDISFSLKRGEFIAIVGPSGSGKSTLLSIIGALLTPSSGKVMIDKSNIADYKPAKLTSVRRDKIGFVFQSSNLIPYLTVKDQLMLIGNISNQNKKIYDLRSAELIQHLGLNHRVKTFPNQLSGGEKQRVAIARAFMNDPDIVLADEPTASLDSERGKQVVNMIAKEVKSRNKAAIMVTHDERMLHVCDRVLHLEDGKLI